MNFPKYVFRYYLPYQWSILRNTKSNLTVLFPTKIILGKSDEFWISAAAAVEIIPDFRFFFSDKNTLGRFRAQSNFIDTNLFLYFLIQLFWRNKLAFSWTSKNIPQKITGNQILYYVSLQVSYQKKLRIIFLVSKRRNLRNIERFP